MSNFLPALAAMLLAPDSSLTRILRVLPTSFGRDVLVGARILLHRVHVHAALVGERAGADVRLAR